MDSDNLKYKSLMKELISESDKHPVLDIKDKKGETGYIDFIDMQEITSSIMAGVDVYGRRFIVLKLIIDGKIVLQTLFQRYWNNIYYWRGCGHHTPNELLFTPNVEIGATQLKLVLSIMRGKIVKITTDHTDHTYNSQYIDKDVYLFDKKRWDASKVIQKHWRLCRYTPNYEMCKTVQNHNIEDTYNERGKVLV